MLALIMGGWIFYSVATVFFIWVCVESAQFVSDKEGSNVILNFFQAWCWFISNNWSSVVDLVCIDLVCIADRTKADLCVSGGGNS